MQAALNEASFRSADRISLGTRVTVDPDLATVTI